MGKKLASWNEAALPPGVLLAHLMQQENMVFCPAKPKGNLNHPSFFYLLSDRDACARTSERLAQLPLVPPASTEKRSTKPARNHSTQTQHPPPMCITIPHFTSPRLALVLSRDTPKPPAPAPSVSIRSYRNNSVLSKSSFANTLHTSLVLSLCPQSCELWTKANTGPRPAVLVAVLVSLATLGCPLPFGLMGMRHKVSA